MELLSVNPTNFPLWKSKISQLLCDSMRINFPDHAVSPDYCEAKCSEIEAYLRNQKATVYLALSGENLLGWIWLHEIRRVDKIRLHVAEIAVAASMRGKGIGTRLLQAAESYAEEHGYSEIDLFVTESNFKAVRFYENADYVSERRLMKKRLKAT